MPERLTGWKRLLISMGIGAVAAAGAQKLAVDSPVHIGVVGEAPAQAEGWACAPEGGLIGAPMVCRYTAASTGFDTSTETQ